MANTIVIDVRMMWSSGIGSYIRNLVPAVMDLLSQERFCLLGNPSEMEQWAGFRWPNVQWVGVRSPLYSLTEQGELARKAPSDADLFWSPHYNFPLLWRKKLVVTVHDVFHLANPQFVPGLHRRLYARFMFRQLVRRTDAILCVSQFTKGELLRLAGGDAGKMSVIPNGVGQPRVSPPAGERPLGRPYLLFVGNVKPHKNLGRLLQAFALLKDRFPHDLVVVGKKEGFLTGDREVVGRAEAFGDRVRFTGPLSDQELGRFYAFADLLVFPSLYEGFGLPPLEAMASGIPVTCSQKASLPEVCGDAALYFDPYRPEDIAEKITALLEDAGLRQNMIRRGLERVRGFRWEQSAAETAKVLQKLLNGGS